MNARLDAIWTEKTKSFGPITKSWILAMFNDCLETESPLVVALVGLLKVGKTGNGYKLF